MAEKDVLTAQVYAQAMLQLLKQNLIFGQMKHAAQQEHGVNLSNVVAIAEGREPQGLTVSIKQPPHFIAWDFGAE